MLTEYTVHIDSNDHKADFKLKYKAGKFHSLELLRGKINQKQHAGLFVLCPQMEAEIATIEIELAGRVTWVKKDKSVNLTALFVATYASWYNEKFDLLPQIRPMDAAAAKKIASIILKQAVTDNEACAVWESILNSWHKLDAWYQNQTDLVQINKNINYILKTLKHGKFTEQGARKADAVSADFRAKFKA